MGCAHHKACNPTPQPTTRPRSKIETQALIEFVSHVKTQQASVVWVDQNPLMGLGDVEGQLDQLFISIFQR